MYGVTATRTTELKDRYIVWSPTATQPPTVVFGNRPEAIKLAHLMANKFPGDRFAVCKIVGVAQTKTVSYEDFGG